MPSGKKSTRNDSSKSSQVRATRPDHPRDAAIFSELLSAEQELLRTIRDAAEPDRYDIIVKANRETVDALIRNRLIRVRKIPRSNIPGGTISRKQAKNAVISVMRARESSGTNETE